MSEVQQNLLKGTFRQYRHFLPHSFGGAQYRRRLDSQMLPEEPLTAFEVDASSLLDSLPDAIIGVDVKGHLVASNAATCALLGTSKRRLQGAHIGELESLSELRHLFERAGRGAVVHAECRVMDARGEPVEASVVMGPTGDGTGGFIVSLRPARRAAEQRARRGAAEKARFLAALSAGMAHEIRNPLGGIRGAAQLLEHGSEPEELSELCGLIVREVDRIDELVGRWLELGSPRGQRAESVSLNLLIRQELELLEVEAPAQVGAWRLDLDPSLPDCEGYPRELRSLVGNLLRNARQAAGDGGLVRVRTRLRSGERLTESGRGLGRRLSLLVEDGGAGVPAEARSRIFEPFYTGRAEGTGMGLFVAQKAAHDHGGTLRLVPSSMGGAGFLFECWEFLPSRPEGP